MIELPKDMNWKAFADYLASRYDWLRVTVDDFEQYNGKSNCKSLTRANHIFSDIEVSGEKVILRLQDGDPFVDGVDVLLSTFNSVIRKKYECFFLIERVSYI